MDNSKQMMEQPLHDLGPANEPLSPCKCIKDMTDDELAAWHCKLREFQTPQTLQAELRRGGSKVKKDEQPPEGFSLGEYV